MDITIIIILLLLSFISGMVGVVIGGAGLLMTPALIAMGLSPHIAVGTTRAGFFTAPFIGLYNFSRKKLVLWRLAVIAGALGLIGNLVGLFFFFSIPETLLKIIVAAVTIAGITLLFVKKDLGVKRFRRLSRKHTATGFISIFLIAVYAGMYGPMYAILLSYTLVIFFGMTFLESSATRKLFGIIRMVSTVPILVIAGKVMIAYALVLLAGSSAGSYLGSRYADRLSNNTLRIGFIVITLFALLKMFV